MNKTEAKILDCALKMYNEQGIDSITVRHIAKEMGIRHSNITYYFPKKDDIIEVLYHKMQGEIDEILDSIAIAVNDAFDFAIFKKGIDILYKYRFVQINNAEIFKRLPELKGVYDMNREKRKASYIQIATDLKKQKFLKTNLDDIFLKLLIQNITLINDFWVVFCDLNPGRSFDDIKNNYLRLILSAFLPYLTEKGVGDFEKMIKDLA